MSITHAEMTPVATWVSSVTTLSNTTAMLRDTRSFAILFLLALIRTFKCYIFRFSREQFDVTDAV